LKNALLQTAFLPILPTGSIKVMTSEIITYQNLSVKTFIKFSGISEGISDNIATNQTRQIFLGW